MPCSASCCASSSRSSRLTRVFWGWGIDVHPAEIVHNRRRQERYETAMEQAERDRDKGERGEPAGELSGALGRHDPDDHKCHRPAPA